MELRADVYNRKQLEQTINNSHIGKIYAPYQIIDDKLSSISINTAKLILQNNSKESLENLKQDIEKLKQEHLFAKIF